MEFPGLHFNLSVCLAMNCLNFTGVKAPAVGEMFFLCFNYLRSKPSGIVRFTKCSHCYKTILKPKHSASELNTCYTKQWQHYSQGTKMWERLSLPQLRKNKEVSTWNWEQSSACWNLLLETHYFSPELHGRELGMSPLFPTLIIHTYRCLFYLLGKHPEEIGWT